MDLKIALVDLIIVILYFSICVILGTAKKVRVKNLREFAVGSGHLPLFGIVTMIFATHIGAGCTVGDVEQIHLLGLLYAVAVILSPMFWLVNSWIFADNIERFDKCISLSDIMEKLYGKFARNVTSVLAILNCMGAVAMQISALGFLSSYLFGISNMLGIFISASVIVAYLTIGGAKSIVVNDIFQFCIFYVAIPILCAILLYEAGGIQSVIANIPAEFKEINLGADKWLFISLVFYSLIPETSAPLVQRFLMARNSTHLKKSLFYVAFLNLSFAIIMIIIGFTSIVLAPGIEPSKALYHMIATYMPLGISGLLISGLLAIIMSTAHSWINTSAVILSDDIAPYFIKNLDQRKKLMLARISVVLVILGAIAISSSGKGIIGILWLSENVWLPVMLVPIILGFKGVKTTPLTFKATFIAALTATFTAAYFREDFDTLSLFLGIITSLITFVAVHNFQRVKTFDMSEIKDFIMSKCNFKKHITRLKKSLYNAKYFNTSKSVIFWGFIFFQYIPSMLEASLSGVVFDFTQMLLRSLPVLLVVIFMTHEYWPNKIRNTAMIPLWNCTVFYTLSFNAFLMLSISEHKMIWIVNLLISLILLVTLLNAKRAILMAAAGFSSALFIKSIYVFTPGTSILTDFHSLILASSYGAISIGLILMLNYIFAHDISSKQNEIINIAHEAKAPFALCYMNIAAVESAISDLNFDNKTYANINKEDVDYIMQSVKKLKSICDEGIVSVSKLLGQQNASAEDVDIYDLVQDISNKISDRRVVNKLPRNKVFSCYKISMQLAIENIIRNASLHSKASKIEISLVENDLIIEDDGVGITEGNISRITKDGFGTSESGSGFGLSIAKRFIEQNYGSLKVESSYGDFSRFIITLPFQK